MLHHQFALAGTAVGREAEGSVARVDVVVVVGAAKGDVAVGLLAEAHPVGIGGHLLHRVFGHVRHDGHVVEAGGVGHVHGVLARHDVGCLLVVGSELEHLSLCGQGAKSQRAEACFQYVVHDRCLIM